MKVSVVIPTYKRPELVLRCLNALKEQTFAKANYEIIVVSDGPDPATERAIQTVAEHWPAMKYFELEKKQGPAAARNYGWEQSVGTLVLFTDDDCIPDQEWITSYWDAHEAHPYDEAAFSGRTVVPIRLSPPTTN